MVTEIKVIKDCCECREQLSIDIPDYILFLYHKYILRINIDYVCEECS